MSLTEKHHLPPASSTSVGIVCFLFFYLRGDWHISNNKYFFHEEFETLRVIWRKEDKRGEVYFQDLPARLLVVCFFSTVLRAWMRAG